MARSIIPMLGAAALLQPIVANAQAPCCFVVPNDDMLPTFIKGQSLRVVPLSPIEGLRRGDVVIFVPPKGGDPVIERVIGLPGDRVQLNAGKLLINNNEALY